MVKKKDVEIKDSGYFARKRSERELYSPEAREFRQKIREKERKEEAEAHVQEMLDKTRREQAEKAAEKRRLWEETSEIETTAEEKPRIQIIEGKTAFKPDGLSRNERPEVSKGAIKVPVPEKPKAVIKKAGQRAKEIPIGEDILSADIPFFEKAARIKGKEELPAEPVQPEEKRQESLFSASAEPPIRPMLKPKGQESWDYDENKLATESFIQGVQVKSLNKAPEKHLIKRGMMSEVNDGIAEKTYNKDESEARVFRHELKYYITEADYYLLRNSLDCLLKHDGNAGENGDYYIRSLYFDDYKNSAMVDKLNGIENRRKYRIRIYGLSDRFIRLERKNKTNDYISKDNLVLTRDEFEKVTAGDIAFLLKKDNQLAKDFYYEIKTKNLKPAVIVDYVREAYVHPIRNLRITFDKVVKSGRYSTDIFDPNVPLATVLPPGTVVLEIKFQHGMPDYLIGVLNTALASQRSAISKYALCRKFES